MKSFLRLGFCLGLAFSAGCLNTSIEGGVDGQEVFTAMQRTVESASASVARSVVPVRIYGAKSSSTPRFTIIGGHVRASSVHSRTSIGIVMSDDGEILIPGVYKPGEGIRISVWLAEDEYQAKVLKSDDSLNRTLIKIIDDVTTVPLPRIKFADPKTGSWCVAVTPSNETKDFVKFSSLLMCRGQIDGQYRTFVFDNVPRTSIGAPVVDMSGTPVGIVLSMGNVVALSDMNPDLQQFIDDATATKATDDEDDDGKGRLGVILNPINKDYAKEHGLPRYGLWVDYVGAGSPAAAAGMKVGDLIVGLNGKPLRFSGKRSQTNFIKMLRPKIGGKFEIEVMRAGGKKKTLRGVFDKQPEEKKLFAKDIGVEVKEITDSDVFTQNLFTSKGVLITKIESGSPAATSARFRQSLLMKGDVIMELGGRPTPTLAEFTKVLEQVRKENPGVLLVAYMRGTATGYAGLNLKIGKEKKEVTGDR